MKVGDKVVLFRGTERERTGTIIAREERYWCIARDDGVRGSGPEGSWRAVNASVSLADQQEQKTAYTFQVGDKGKTREGQPYRIINTDRDHPSRRVTLALVHGKGGEVPVACFADGAYYEHTQSGFDLLPPTITVYQLTCSNRIQMGLTNELTEERIIMWTFTTEAAAKEHAAAMKGYYKDMIITPIEREKA